MQFLTVLCSTLGLVVGNWSIGQNSIQVYTYGNVGQEYGSDFKRTLDSGYVIAGTTDNCGATQTCAYSMKIDKSGKTIWSHSTVLDFPQFCNAVVQTPDSGFVFSGYGIFKSGGTYESFAMRMDKNGNSQWLTTLGEKNQLSYDILAGSKKDLFLVGKTWSETSGGADAFILKSTYSSSGVVTWTKKYGGSNDDEFRAADFMADSTIVAVGQTTHSESLDKNIYVARFKQNGDTIWTKSIGTKLEDRAYGVTVSKDNHIYVAGSSIGVKSNNLNQYGAKLDSDGNLIWDVFHSEENSTHDDVLYDVTEMPNGKIMFAGYSNSYGTIGMEDISYHLLDINGNWLNGGTTGQPNGNSRAYKILPLNDSSFATFGSTRSWGLGQHDIVLCKHPKVNFTGLKNAESWKDEALCTTGLSETSSTAIKVVPNPSTGQFIIDAGAKLFGVMEIYNTVGKLVLTKTISTNSIMQHHLPPGLYVLKFSVDGNSLFTRVIVE